jgi:hypothetical protein
MANLGAPAALVGGAALASFFELRDRLAPLEQDGRRIRFAKNTVVLLLLSSFACEIACVFVTTIAGDQLMSNADTPSHHATNFDKMHGGFLNEAWGRGVGRTDCNAKSPGGMMWREMEFEYVASRFGFFQVLVLMLASCLCFSLCCSLRNEI